MIHAARTPSTMPPRIAVVIPCFRVKRHILDVISHIGPEVDAIYVVDDSCPEGSGAFVTEHVSDPRVTVMVHEKNQGVGGATLTGMRQAAEKGATVVVKIDGDGQMDPALIDRFVTPILRGEADYTKGNRFYDLDRIRSMPTIRLAGNAVLSFVTKLSSGYWDVFDPTNGYVAIHTQVLKQLPLEKISRRYFFESDLLYRLYTVRAVVMDIPMHAHYGGEESSLKIGQVIGPFVAGHLHNMFKRILYTYYLRDFSLASIYLPIGLLLCAWGTLFGLAKWSALARLGIPASAGTVMLAALPVIVGFQLLLGFLGMDVANVPRTPLQARLFGSAGGRPAAQAKVVEALRGGPGPRDKRLADAVERLAARGTGPDRIPTRPEQTKAE
jgi:dolichol-phosphate mannosyltransferase